MRKIISIITVCVIFISTTVNAQIIGVSAIQEDGLAATPLTYINAIKRAGGTPIVIPMTDDIKQIEGILNIIDGLVMTGGEDIDPLKYFGEEPHPALGRIAPERDTFDMLLLKAAVKKGIPILGICRGHQLINVAFGGTLYQDIPSQVKGTFVKHSQKAPRTLGTHSIEIQKGSILHKVLKTETIAVNSFHHQAVKDLAQEFIITAKSKDGVVEAIESTSHKIMGVQFHPEGFVSAGDDRFIGIFNWLIENSIK